MIGGLLIIILSVYIMALIHTLMTTGLEPITLYMLKSNSTKTLKNMVKPGIKIKSDIFTHRWGKSDYGNYKTSWTFIDPKNRRKTSIDLEFNLKGKITYIDSSDESSFKKYLGDDVIFKLSEYMA